MLCKLLPHRDTPLHLHHFNIYITNLYIYMYRKYKYIYIYIYIAVGKDTCHHHAPPHWNCLWKYVKAAAIYEHLDIWSLLMRHFEFVNYDLSTKMVICDAVHGHCLFLACFWLLYLALLMALFMSLSSLRSFDLWISWRVFSFGVLERCLWSLVFCLVSSGFWPLRVSFLHGGC